MAFSHIRRITSATPPSSDGPDDDKGASVRVTDFAPRFRNFDRILASAAIDARDRAGAGMPRITIRVRPT